MIAKLALVNRFWLQLLMALNVPVLNLLFGVIQQLTAPALMSPIKFTSTISASPAMTPSMQKIKNQTQPATVW